MLQQEEQPTELGKDNNILEFHVCRSPAAPVATSPHLPASQAPCSKRLFCSNGENNNKKHTEATTCLPLPLLVRSFLFLLFNSRY